MGRPLGAWTKQAELDPAQVRRIRAQWMDPECTMTQMISTHSMSQERIEKLCSDLPPRFKAEGLRRQAPSGLRRCIG